MGLKSIPAQMKWESLLSLQRWGDNKKRERKNENTLRLGFEVDFDRVIFSSPFRRLQDKTQVIPLPKTQFAHTRLTHSLETSSVGRSLGRIVGKHIIEAYPNLEQLGFKISDFGSIVGAACLAHDIGNPPFGHSGEEIIRSFFLQGKAKQYRGQLTDLQWLDLTRYEGNANGFNILTHCQNGIKGGLRLSYAVLGAFLKYPKDSSITETPNVAHSKYGYFQKNKKEFLEIVKELGLKKTGINTWARHPLAFLVEAADDICYTIIDFEDGLNYGMIPEEIALELMIPIVKQRLIREKYHSLRASCDRFAYLRALSIGILIEDMAQIFIKYEHEILNGDFPHSLKSKSRYKAQMDDIIEISKDRLYHHPQVIEKEIAGFEIVEGLMDYFMDIMVMDNENEMNYRKKIIYRLIPEKFRGEDFYSDSLYDQLLNMCGFVASLTDQEALDLFQKIKGMKIL